MSKPRLHDRNKVLLNKNTLHAVASDAPFVSITLGQEDLEAIIAACYGQEMTKQRRSRCKHIADDFTRLLKSAYLS